MRSQLRWIAHATLVQWLALVLLSTHSAMAESSTPLTGPSDFSGSEVLIDFDGLGLIEGDPVPTASGVTFMMSDGRPAFYFNDRVAREFGPNLPGSIANFRMSAFPYPDLELTFSETVHRLSFELGALATDQIQVTLLSAGTVVDTTTFASIGWNRLYFYGLENEAGFDEVWIHVTPDPVRRTGYFSFDNLQFESFEPPVPIPDSFTCIGMTSSSGTVLSSSNPVHELTALLVDHADGSLVMDEAVADRPMAGVFFSSAAGDPEVDVTEMILAAGSDRFEPTLEGAWQLDLLSDTLLEPGVYRVTMFSPNDLDYTIESTCDFEISRMAPEVPEEPEVLEEPGDDECDLKSKRHWKGKKHWKDKKFKKHKRHMKHAKHMKQMKHAKHEKHEKHVKHKRRTNHMKSRWTRR